MIKRSIGEHIFDGFNYTLLFIVVVLTLYPFWYIVVGSFSETTKFAAHSGILLTPLGFSTEAYTAVLANKDVWVGYRNTLFYVVFGTAINMAVTIVTAYVVSRKNLYFKRALLFFAVFTMYFSGGLIPTYLQINNLGLVDTLWALLLPGAMSTYNMIVLRTAFLNVPDSLEESARLDGAGDLTMLFRIYVPLTIPTIAVLILFYAVGHWNSWFGALIYIRKRSLYPLQIFLREILLRGSAAEMVDATDFDAALLERTVKFATIVVSTVPVLCIYPFVQKYFVKGVMIGAIKG